MKYTVTYGIESQERESINPPTIGQIIQDPVLKAVLGYSDNVRALVHGVEQPTHAAIPDGCNIVLETKANTKAS